MLNEQERPWLARLFSSRKPATEQQQDNFSMDGLGLFTPKAFQEEIEREILRSDRCNLPLTLLLLAIKGHSRPAHEIYGYSTLARIVASRVRRTDCQGWHEDGSRTWIGILLWNTPSNRVDGIVASLRQAFLECIQSDFGGKLRPLELDFEVLAYPRGNDDNNGNNGNGTRRGLFHEDGRNEDIKTLAPNTNNNGPEGRNGHQRKKVPIPPIAHPGATHSLDALCAHSQPGWKRGMDVILSLLFIIMLSPILLAIAIAIKLTSRGPILYKQDRVGIRGDIFKCLKFRSMQADYDCSTHRKHIQKLITDDGQPGAQQSEKPMEKLDGCNPHITHVGRIIRSSHLDELPQLFNVLLGDMSLVGPRPCIPYETEHYQQWCNRRFDILPGITGLWQVKGRNKTTFKEMIRLDLDYIQRCSPLLDIKIVLMTIPTILTDVYEAWKSKRRESSNDLQKV